MDLQQIVEMLSQMDANMKAGQKKMHANMTEMGAKMGTNQARMEDRLKEEIKSIQANAEVNMKIHRQEIVAKIDANQVKMEAIVHSIRSERDGKIQDRIENVMKRQEVPKEGAAVHTMRAWQEETVASLECKEPSPKEWESEAERREVPMKDAVEKRVRGRKKRQRGRHIAAGRRGKPKELTRRDWGSRK
jgi:hypothetical protein